MSHYPAEAASRVPVLVAATAIGRAYGRRRIRRELTTALATKGHGAPQRLHFHFAVVDGCGLAVAHFFTEDNLEAAFDAPATEGER